MIVFSSNRGFDGSHIWLGASDGSSVRRLTKAYASEATWSRDGRRLAFVAIGTRGKRDLFVMNADGSRLRHITRTPAEEHHPSWSPDGKRIAFVREGKRRQDIYVIKTHGAGERRLTASLRCKRSPAWSPNGRQIAFAGCEGYPSRLYLVRPDGTRERPLPFRGDDPDWSPEEDGLRTGGAASFASPRSTARTNGHWLRTSRPRAARPGRRTAARSCS
jgi:TolB protein